LGATYDLTPFGFPDERLRPPASLGDLEKRAFLDLIDRVPAGQFRESDLPLICRWCELTVVAERAAAEMSAGNLVTDDDRPSPWFSIHERATKSLGHAAASVAASAGRQGAQELAGVHELLRSHELRGGQPR
jgi:hypothetical protein